MEEKRNTVEFTTNYAPDMQIRHPTYREINDIKVTEVSWKKRAKLEQEMP